MEDIADYLAATCSEPPPDAEEERELFLAGERDELIMRNTRLVVSIAKRYQGLGLPFRDLVQEGIVGLIIAIDRFEIEQGYRLSTYAAGWIRRMIVNAIKAERTIRIPRNMVDDLSQIAAARERLTQELSRQPHDEEVATETGMEADYIHCLERADSVLSLEPDNHLLQHESSHDPEQKALDYAIVSMLELIDRPRMKDVLKRHWLMGQSYQEIAESYTVTRSRIQQIGAEGVEWMQEMLGVD